MWSRAPASGHIPAETPMRVLTVIPLSAAVGAMVALLPAGLLIGAVPRTPAHSNLCESRRWRRKCEIDPRSRRNSAPRPDQEPAPRSQSHDWLTFSMDFHRPGGRSGRGRTVLPVAPAQFGGGNQPNGRSGWGPTITDSPGGETPRRAAPEREGCLRSA